MALEFQQFGRGISAYGTALPYLFKPGYRRYLALPVLLNLLLLGLVLWASFRYSGLLLEYALGLFGFRNEDLPGPALLFLRILLQILQVLFFLSIYKYLVLVVLAPFLAFLSEKVERDLSGQDFPFSWSQFLRDVFRALRINGWNLLREWFFTLLLFLFSWIPVIGWASPLGILLVQAYFYGYGLMDYNAERWRYSFRETEGWMWKQRGLVLAVGLVFYFVFLIPGLGWILAPIWGVVAGTLGSIEHKKTGGACTAGFFPNQT